jgi:hypothetical protein
MKIKTDAENIANRLRVEAQREGMAESSLSV